MRKILYCLGEITDADVDWISGAGSRRVVNPGTTLVEQGRPLEALFILLRGKMSVSVGNRVISEVGAGEVIGELSLLDSRPPSATVVAVETTVVWEIPITKIRSKLKSDTGFASRFYRSIGMLLAHRMRQSTLKLAFGDADERGERSFDHEDPMEVDPGDLNSLTLAGIRFQRMQSELLGTGN